MSEEQKQPGQMPETEAPVEQQGGTETAADKAPETAEAAAQGKETEAAPAAQESAEGSTEKPQADEPQPQADEPAKEPEAPETAEKPAGKEKKSPFGKKTRELEAAEAKLAAAEQKQAELKEQLMRTAAEYDNFRKRSAREADGKFNDGISFAVTQIIPILDTLDMAANAPCADENYKKGVTMTLDKASKAFETLKITEIEAAGKPFDPNLMNAVSQVPAPEGTESGSVVTVYQKGYMLGDKVIRHATVVVAE